MSKMVGGTFAIAMLFFSAYLAWGNDRTGSFITGRITDAKSEEPLAGVNVLLVDTFRGAATRNDGSYEIRNLPPGKYTLRTTMVGYEVVEKEVTTWADGTAEVDFAMVPSALEVPEVVVTATALPRLFDDVPVQTKIISRSLIQAQKAANLAEALDLQTGVRVENNCQNCNFTQVRLLGLEGHYSQILIDSDPVVSSLAGVYGLEQFPDEMIERVEIVKGGGSALYGGTAVAGVINLITRRPTHNELTFDHRTSSVSGELDHKLGFTHSRVSNSGKSSGYLFGTIRRRQSYDHNDDGFSEIGVLENEAIGLNWYFRPVNKGELALHLHHIHEDRRGGNKFDLAPHFADIAEAIESWRYGGSLSWTQAPAMTFDYKAYFSVAHTDRDSYYGAEQDPNAYGETSNPLLVTGLQTNYRLSNHVLTASIQYQHEGLRDEAIAYDRIIDDTYTDLGLVLQDNISWGDFNHTEIIIGTRLDKHSEIDKAILSPRIALKWAMNESFTFRSGLSTGFKPPQVFDEDLHITQVAGEGQIIRNSDGLVEERSTTIYSGLEYQEILGMSGLRVNINGFFTHLDNTFQLNQQDDPATAETEFFRINGAGAEVKGLEFEVGLRFTKGELAGGLTLQSSKWEKADPDFNSFDMFRTPDVYGNMRLSYDLSRQFNILAVTKYTGPMYVPHYAGYIDEDRLEKSGSFLTFDLLASYKIPLFSHLYGKLTLGTYNVTNAFQDDFDKGIARDAGYVYGPMTPRRFLFSISVGH